MTRGLLTPLSPQEEIALRRIAYGSVAVDARDAARLVSLALVERVHASLRLTPLGRLRFNALPQAPLLGRRRSLPAAAGYVSGVIEKAQSRANAQPSPATASLPRKAASPSVKNDDDDVQWQSIVPSEPDRKWRAECNIDRLRKTMVEHRRRQQELCDGSHRRITMSRLLLRQTMPVMPPWMIALQ